MTGGEGREPKIGENIQVVCRPVTNCTADIDGGEETTEDKRISSA